MIKLTKYFVCIFTVMILFICGNVSNGQESTNSQSISPKLASQLSKKVVEFNLTDTSLWHALGDLADNNNVIIGFEFKVPEPGQIEEENINLDIPEGTLGDVINKVVQTDPSYKWVTIDDVINVFPKNAQHPILETVLKDFQVHHLTAYQASQALTDAPEVASVIKQLGLYRHDPLNLTGNGEYLRGKLINLKLHNVTVRQVLNEIMKASGRNAWVFSVYGDHNQFFTIGV